MSAARRNWADVDEEDDDDEVMDTDKGKGSRFESPVDENGIKTVWEYLERDGKTYKVTKKVKETKITTWTNKHIQDRKGMSFFGKAASNEAAAEKQLVVKSVEEVPLEVTKKLNQQVVVKDDAEEKFYEESIALAESLNKEKKVWTDMRKEKREEEEPVGATAPTPAEATGNSVRDAMKGGAAAGPAAPGKPAAYVPPSLRGAGDGKGDGKGKGKDFAQQQEASLRVTNLSEDCREGDLQDLFAQFGRLARVYLAKDQETYQSRGFAFITYYTKEDAQRAINKLHGHGYDNLILSVQFAKPKA